MSRSSKAQDLQEEEQKLNVQDRGYTMFGLACLMNHTQTPASMRAAQAYRNIRKREEAAGRWNSRTVKNCKKAEISQQWKRRKICKLILELQEEQQDPALLKKKEMLRRHFEAEEPDRCAAAVFSGLCRSAHFCVPDLTNAPPRQPLKEATRVTGLGKPSANFDQA